MRPESILRTLRARIGQFKQLGYDLESSRLFILKKSTFLKGTVLEIGAGKGHLAAYMARKGLNVISVDIDPDTLRLARKHLTALKQAARVSFKKINAEKLPFPAHSFQQVISVDFFHHAQNPLQCLREIMRVTGGALLIADLNNRGMNIMERLHRLEGKQHPLSKITFRTIKAQLMQNNFEVKSYRHACHQILLAKRRSL